jgi:hypothetical protein
MKRFACVLVVVPCTSLLTFAQEQDHNKKADGGKDMAGMVCYSSCVDTTASRPACKKDCSETSGDMSFVSDKGKVFKIDNQDKVTGMSGKKVKVKASIMSTDMMHIYEIAPVTY